MMQQTYRMSQLFTLFFISLGLMLYPSKGMAAGRHDYQIQTVAQGFDHPWGMVFLPNKTDLLVTEKKGILKQVNVQTGQVSTIEGTPMVDSRGQGGLLDIALSPNFSEDHWVYLTWSGRDKAGNTTIYLGRGKFNQSKQRLTDLTVLFSADPHVDGTGHYGGRIVFDDQGYLYMTVGDRQFKNFGSDHVAQDLTTHLGKTLRFNADGSIPDDNPFVDQPNAKDAIYSYGHRNSQGMAISPETGQLWQNEHGEQNGDEINVIQAGGNYGWPIATYGVSYRTGKPFAQTPQERPDTIDPVYFWGPDDPEGFPPSGLTFYQGDAFKDWQGDILMGNLRHQYLGRFTVDGHQVDFTQRLLDQQDWRIRAVTVGPEHGYIYVLIDGQDVPLVRLVPDEG